MIESEVDRAFDYITSLVREDELQCVNERDYRRKTFALLLNLLWRQFNEDETDESPKLDASFFPIAASTCDFYKDRNAIKSKSVVDNEEAIEEEPQKINRASKNYVPDTCYIAKDFKAEMDEDINPNIVPETQEKFETFECSGSVPNVARRLQNFDTICPDVTDLLDSKRKKEKQENSRLEEKQKDDAIREKYGKLPINQTKRTESESSSPSVLKSVLKRPAIDDNDVDFKPNNMSPPEVIAQKSKKKKSYSVEVTPVTNSQLAKIHNAKQTKIQDLFSRPKKTNKEDDDIELAIKQSLLDASNQNDTFNDYDASKGQENDCALANNPGRSKEDRQKLSGFSCKDCEKYYADANLNDEQLQEAIQKCSRHRAAIAPPSDSPQEMWKLEIDDLQNKTQVGSPLKTRKRRKMSRQQIIENP